MQIVILTHVQVLTIIIIALILFSHMEVITIEFHLKQFISTAYGNSKFKEIVNPCLLGILQGFKSIQVFPELLVPLYKSHDY